MAIGPQLQDWIEVESLGSQGCGSLERTQGRNYLLAIHMEEFHCSNERNSHVDGCKLPPSTCACTKFPLQRNSEWARAFYDLKGSRQFTHCPRLHLGSISIVWHRICLVNATHQMNKPDKIYGHGSKMKLTLLFSDTFLKYCLRLLTISISQLVEMRQE